MQLGAGSRKVKNVTRAQRGHFAKAQVEPKAKVVEFRVTPDNLIDVGAELTADHFVTGQYVDVTGTSIGKGFTGAMKRWNFGGLRATHGVSVSHRSHGSTGNTCEYPGKLCWEDTGHYGDERVTTQNLQVVRTDVERELILIRGAVPGSKGGWVLLRDAGEVAALPEAAPKPGAFRKPEHNGACAGAEAGEMKADADDPRCLLRRKHRAERRKFCTGAAG